MDNSKSQNQNIRKLNELIQDIQIAMLTTSDKEGTLHSRPMITQPEKQFDGEFWFITYGSADKVFEIQHNPQVNLVYAKPESELYVSISGQAEVIHDPDRVKTLWNMNYDDWFPQGLQTPDLALIKVNVNQAEYWDKSSNKMVRVVGFINYMAGDPSYYEGREHGEIDLNGKERRTNNG